MRLWSRLVIQRCVSFRVCGRGGKDQKHVQALDGHDLRRVEAGLIGIGLDQIFELGRHLRGLGVLQFEIAKGHALQGADVEAFDGLEQRLHLGAGGRQDQEVSRVIDAQNAFLGRERLQDLRHLRGRDMLKAHHRDAGAGRQFAMAGEVEGFAAAASRFGGGQDAVKLAILDKRKARRGQRRLKGGNEIGLFDGPACAQRDALLDAGIDDDILTKDGAEHRLRDLAHIGLGKIELDLVVTRHLRAAQSRRAPGQIRRCQIASGLGGGRALVGGAMRALSRSERLA